MNDHAFLAPSGRWPKCAASALMERQYPQDPENVAAMEGIAAHWVWERMQLNGSVEAGRRAPNGIEVTLEMLEAADLMFDDVTSTLASAGSHTLKIESRVAIPRIHPEHCWGTPDARAMVQTSDHLRTLYVWDLKYGHKHVEVFENAQLTAYAAGALSEAHDLAQAAKQTPWPETQIEVVLRVVQPRSYHRDGPIREWRLSAVALRPYIARLAAAAQEALKPTPLYSPSPEACENCTGRHACEALQRTAYQGAALASQSTALELTPAALGLELRILTEAAGLMQARISGLEEQAVSLFRKGQGVPHWAMQASPGRKVWTVPAAEVLALGEVLGLPLAKPIEPITPTQAAKAGLSADLLAAYSSTPTGSAKLILDNGTEARKVFVAQ